MLQYIAKITFWLNENGHRVLIAAGDTFRAGAVEQLRTHTRSVFLFFYCFVLERLYDICSCLNSLHKEQVQLYEQGYGADSARLAGAAIEIARERGIDVVLVDTAGRMQDNAPLMKALGNVSIFFTNTASKIFAKSSVDAFFPRVKKKLPLAKCVETSAHIFDKKN